MSMIRKLEEDSSSGALPSAQDLPVHGVSHSAHLGTANNSSDWPQRRSRSRRRLAVIYLPTVSRPHLGPTWEGLKGRAEKLMEDDAEDDSPFEAGNDREGMLRFSCGPKPMRCLSAATRARRQHRPVLSAGYRLGGPDAREILRDSGGRAPTVILASDK
jgi:hypothetical protein